MVQLEIVHADGRVSVIGTDLTCGLGEPVCRIEAINPVSKIASPSGKTIIDFGQNIVGYVKLSGIRGVKGQKVILSHAEVLENGENGELGTRPLRHCKAVDEYTIRGDNSGTEGESYEPRFTFHGFRYAQVDGWPGDDVPLSSVKAIICHTDMKSAGSFSSDHDLLNKLYQNIRFTRRKTGLDGRSGTLRTSAVLLYDCFGMLKNWLLDLMIDQAALGGVPPMVCPDALPKSRKIPLAIWHDVTILLPWTLYQETGDAQILSQQYESMLTWMKRIPRDAECGGALWDTPIFQLGDWLDPAAPPDEPWRSSTDANMVANMFLIRSLDLMTRISDLLGRDEEKAQFAIQHEQSMAAFHHEYVAASGRVSSDSQTAYALAICFDILRDEHGSQPRARAGRRLAELVPKANFRITTGFAGTPFVCEALAATGHVQVAYALLLETKCPSWLYPVTMGATTTWERWDSMLPDGTINSGEMTSFNHYAYGAVAKFMQERIAGLQCLAPGWARCRVAPCVGAEFKQASATHETRHGTISCSWTVSEVGDDRHMIEVKVVVPRGVTVEVVMPDETTDGAERREVFEAGAWTVKSFFRRDYEWPVKSMR